ncbi:MAG TPA: hypothetical protein DDY32_00645, partial [Desulfobulbaceae bacterium]|nr:hypothetical protein [Desulfobulbaceae bacterium]
RSPNTEKKVCEKKKRPSLTTHKQIIKKLYLLALSLNISSPLRGKIYPREFRRKVTAKEI